MARPEHDAEQERLDQLQEDIDEVRRRAQEHGTLPRTDHERTLIDPDGDGDTDEDPGAIGG